MAEIVLLRGVSHFGLAIYMKKSYLLKAKEEL
jgi:hypothetical protein